MILFLTSIIFDLLYGKLFRENKYKDIPKAIFIFLDDNGNWVMIDNLDHTGIKKLFDTREELEEYCNKNHSNILFNLCSSK